MATLKERFRGELFATLKERLGVENDHQVPVLDKIVVNMGLGIQDKDAIKSCAEDLAAITGQKPVLTKARKSISNFKLREGMIVGCRVTLRRDRMYEFLDRLINATLPRIRDFRGLAGNGFDGRGNFTLGIKDQSIFPEIDPNAMKVTQGMDITIVTTAKEDRGARELLALLGLPFAKK